MTISRLIATFCLALTSCWALAQSSNPVGDAYAEGDNCFSITGDILWQLGAVWFNEPVSLEDELEIELLINFGSNDAGADGIVFVFQQVGINALGDPGGGLGFEGFSPSLGIEMDTYQNADFSDPYADHMAVLSNGFVNHNSVNNLFGPVNISSNSDNVEDNTYHPFKLTWDPATMLLEVYFDCELRMSYEIDITNDIFFGDPIVYWGFTGATGGLSNNQSVCISEYALGLPDQFDICLGESAELGVNGSGNGTLEWSPTTGLDDPTSAAPIATPNETTTYTVTFTDLCQQQTSLSTTVNVIDLQADLDPEITLCEGEEMQVEVTTNGTNIEWSNGDSGSVANVTDEGILEATISEANCELTVSTTIDIMPSAIPNSWETQLSACEGDDIVIDGTSDNAIEYEWNSGPQDPTITVSQPGSYEVTLTTMGGCESSFEVDVDFVPYPTPFLPDSSQLCEGQSIVLSPGIAETYIWSDGSSDNELEITSTGEYDVIMANGECASMASTSVSFYPLPQFEWPFEFDICANAPSYAQLPEQDYVWAIDGIQVTDSVLIQGDEMTLVGTDVQTECFNTWTSQINTLELPLLELAEFAILCDGDPVTVNAITNYDENLEWENGTQGNEITFTLPGDYTVSTYNQCGTVTDSISIMEGLCACELYVPNAFSPNHDGRNDLFLPEFDCTVEDYVFSIVNRWGEIIFQTDTPGIGWYGNVKGNEHYAQDDVYVWHVKYTVRLVDGVKLIDEKGMVQVFR